jgi:hypothetical protein
MGRLGIPSIQFFRTGGIQSSNDSTQEVLVGDILAVPINNTGMQASNYMAVGECPFTLEENTEDARDADPEILIAESAIVPPRSEQPETLGNLLQTPTGSTQTLINESSPAIIKARNNVCFPDDILFLEACRCGVFDEIVDVPQDILETTRTREGKTGLQIACEKAHLDVIIFLLGRGVSVNTLDNDGWTPLHSAAFEGHGEVVELLLRCQGRAGDGEKSEGIFYPSDGPILVDAVAIDENGKEETAAEMAANEKHHGIAALLNGNSS